ncbi:MAG: PAS domain-containing protein [Formivibrio sp.]|nr:PAS domain-containing protein [Formivibrio sp.]
MNQDSPQNSAQTVLRNLVEIAPIRIFWKDLDSRFLGCNSLFAKDAGLTHEGELIGKTDFDMVWKDQAELYRADDQLVMESGTPRLGYEEP